MFLLTFPEKVDKILDKNCVKCAKVTVVNLGLVIDKSSAFSIIAVGAH